MKIRISVAVLPYGNVQLLRGQVLDVPETLALAWVEQEEAVLMPIAERATLPAPQNAMVPRTFAKPKPPVKTTAKGRR
jgi:hypothetical protein